MPLAGPFVHQNQFVLANYSFRRTLLYTALQVVWETLGNIEGDTEFVDHQFQQQEGQVLNCLFVSIGSFVLFVNSFV